MVRDPYARWCERGGAERLPPISINVVINWDSSKKVSDAMPRLRVLGSITLLDGAAESTEAWRLFASGNSVTTKVDRKVEQSKEQS